MKENKIPDIENDVNSKSSSPMKWLIMILSSLALVKYK